MFQELKTFYFYARYGVNYQKTLKVPKKVLFIVFLILLGIYLPCFCFGFTSIWNEDFEDLNLGNINGQGYWYSTQGLDTQVSTDNPYSGEQGLKILWDEASYKTANPFFNPNTDVSSGVIVFSLWVNPFRASGSGESSNNSIFLFRDNSNQPLNGAIIFGFQIDKSLYETNNFFVGNTIGTNVFGEERIVKNDWAKITLTANFDTRKYYIDVFTNAQNWAQYEGAMSSGTNISMMSFECFNCGIYVDDMEYEIPPPAIIINAPENGSTITDPATELEVSWSNIDSSYWTNLRITFNSYQIGESSKIYNKLLTADDGSFSVPLSYFEMNKNGLWTLLSIVENPYEYNFDMEYPTYALTFDVEGWATPYAFTDWDDWYAENVEEYEEPSVWASAMVGYLEPIFEKIGEFGNRITAYLNISDAYTKGFQIGNVFPVIIAYVLKIDMFFGGFPIVQFFKWIIIVMIGLFAVKVILKLLSFIPFFGGGG